MTWLPDTGDGRNELERVLNLRPELSRSFTDLYDVAWRDQLVDPVILEVCRLRMAQLLACEQDLRVRFRQAREAGLGEDKIAELRQWPTSPHYGEAERACLEYSEVFLMDAKSISDEQADAVKQHLSEGEFVALTVAIGLFEAFQRFCLLFDVQQEGERYEVSGMGWP